MLHATVLHVFLASAINMKQPPQQAPTGLWMGTLNILQIQKLRLVVEVTAATPGVFKATLDSPDQGAAGIPIDKFVFADSTMTFESKALKATYEGTLKPDRKVHGTFKQAGMSLPLVLERIKERPTPPGRRQDPKKPYPYLEAEVKVVNKRAKPTVTLAGTLTLPKSPGPHPAVVLITGSGSQNRNEELMDHRPFLVLADHLTRKGIAVLRMDDRGVGGSSKGTKDDTSKDFADDVRAAVEFLRTDRRIDAARIGLVGHSEGGMIAPMVAAQAPESVRFLVLLAGTTLPGEQILYLQGEKILRANGASESDAKANREMQERLFRTIREETDAKKRDARLREEMTAGLKRLPGVLRAQYESEALRKMQVASLTNAWMRFFLAYDPMPTMKSLRCPVLAVWGEKDLQVPPQENIDALKRAIPDWERRNITLKVFPGLNHLFQTCVTGSPIEYRALPETFSPIALDVVAHWILQQTSTNESTSRNERAAGRPRVAPTVVRINGAD
jgi:pimeloyl-ACP methyl ester carboxylesterase